MRLDCFISNEFNISRQKANELIKQGQVSINDIIITKPAYKVCLNDNVKIGEDFFIESSIFCSRAALKLQRFFLNRDSKAFMFAFCDSKLFDKQTPFTKHIEQHANRNAWLQWHNAIQKSNNTESTKDYYPNIQTLVKQAICEMIKDSIILDVGASAGGFTQVLLTYKPKLIIAQDIGNLQLDSALRKRCNVLSIENTDIRIFAKNFYDYMPLIVEKAKIGKSYKISQVQFIVCDVSFISLEHILESLCTLSQSILLLYKPQYEVGLHVKRNKKGVVKDKKAIMQKLESFIKLLQDRQARYIFVEKSLFLGKEGNEEFFIFCQF